MTNHVYDAAGGAHIIGGGRTGVTLRSSGGLPDVALVMSDDDWRQLGAAINRWFPPPPMQRAVTDEEVAEARAALLQARDAGELDDSARIIVDRMERLAERGTGR